MLPRLLEESQVFLSRSISFCMSMSNDSILQSESHRKICLHLRQWKQPVSCRFSLSMLESLEACSPEFTGESYMF